MKKLFFAGQAKSLGGVPLNAVGDLLKEKVENELVIEKIKASYL